jgi:hypothetical protein
MTHRKFLGVLAAALLASALGINACSSSPKPAEKTAETPTGYTPPAPAVKTNPRVVEETATYIMERWSKSELIRVDQDHVRLPISSIPVKFDHEDENYYYIRTEKYSPEELEARRKKVQEEQEEAKRAQTQKELEAGLATADPTKRRPGWNPADYETLVPARASSGVRFEKAGAGLPTSGQWRQNIAVADINGDGIPDIVATPARLTSGRGVKLFLGDGAGNFREQAVEVVDSQGQPARVAIGYGGVAVADFDGDGKPDIATASHGGTVHVLLQRDNFRFQVEDRGLPKSLSCQAVAAFDANGDGRPDLVVSMDSVTFTPGVPIDMHQVRLYLNDLSGAGWTYSENAIVGGYFSNNVFPFPYSGSREPDLLAGANYYGATILTWKNDGAGTFKGDPFNVLEDTSYHTAVAPGSFGAGKVPAIADFYRKFGGTEIGAAVGLNVYYLKDGTWSKIAIWRQKAYTGRNTAVAMGDLNGDGLDDVVMPDNLAKKLRIFYQTADGRFEEAPEATEPALDSPVSDIKIVDLNHDGKNDIVLSKTVYSEDSSSPGGFEVLMNRGGR